MPKGESMAEPKGQRRFQERLIDGFERSRIRHEVLRVKAKDLGTIGKLRTRYAMLVLGASLAVGGLGIPLKSSHMLEQANENHAQAPEAPANDVMKRIAEDLAVANEITREVTGGVTSAVDIASDTLAPILPQSMTLEGPHLVTEKVKEDFFKSEIPFGSIIYKEAKKNDLSPELVAAVVKIESRFMPNARSQAGAQGLMQLVPRTGRWMGAKNLMNPAENVAAGAKYLKYLSERFDGNQTKMIAAYNAGEGNVRRFGGVPPFRETHKYVKEVRDSEAEFKEQLQGKLAESIADASLSPMR